MCVCVAWQIKWMKFDAGSKCVNWRAKLAVSPLSAEDSQSLVR